VTDMTLILAPGLCLRDPSPALVKYTRRADAAKARLMNCHCDPLDPCSHCLADRIIYNRLALSIRVLTRP
jgi:hypothetical protein